MARRKVKVTVDTRAASRGLAAALGPVTEQTLVPGLLAMVHRIRNAAMRHSRVDTGRMRAGWQVASGQDKKGVWAEVSNDVHYAADWELGTHRHGPDPMLAPAVKQVLGVDVEYDIIPNTGGTP